MNTIRHWIAYFRFRYAIWKLNRSLNRFSQQFVYSFAPAIEAMSQAFDMLGQAFSRNEEMDEKKDEHRPD
jgi:hypothetical protein